MAVRADRNKTMPQETVMGNRNPCDFMDPLFGIRFGNASREYLWRGKFLLSEVRESGARGGS